MSALIIRVVDLETTGFPPDADIVEIGAVDVMVAPFRLPHVLDHYPLGRQSIMVRPNRPIPPQASAVHHLVDADVALAATWEEVWPMFNEAAPSAWCAHSAKMERAFITDAMTGGKPWIDTWKCALRLWPDAPSHSNQSLRYWRNPSGLDRALATPAHRAWPDAYVTVHLLVAMLELSSAEELIAWSKEPALLARVPFGAMRGRPWRDADDGFLDWVLARDFDDNVLFTARQEMERREKARASAMEAAE